MVRAVLALAGEEQAGVVSRHPVEGVALLQTALVEIAQRQVKGAQVAADGDAPRQQGPGQGDQQDDHGKSHGQHQPAFAGQRRPIPARRGRNRMVSGTAFGSRVSGIVQP